MSEGMKRQITVQEEMEYEMRPEYDFSKAVLNPYSARVRARAAAEAGAGAGAVTIESELFQEFPTSEAVNEALRSVLKQQEQNAA